MGREYKIRCEPLSGARLSAVMQKLQSPIPRSQVGEIYNYKIEKSGYYLVDYLVDRPTAALALRIFLDAALSNNQTVTVEEP